jgi:uncharacterized protein with PIN domain
MPKCPYCKQKINFENIKKIKNGIGFIKQEIMYYCPHCESLLGISRGKFMS